MTNPIVIKIGGVNYLTWPVDKEKNPTFLIVQVSEVLPEMYDEVASKYYDKLYEGEAKND